MHDHSFQTIIAYVAERHIYIFMISTQILKIKAAEDPAAIVHTIFTIKTYFVAKLFTKNSVKSLSSSS